MSVRFKNARVEKMPLNIRIQWNAGTACVSGCVLKTLACRGLRVGPSKAQQDNPVKRPIGRGSCLDIIIVGPLFLDVTFPGLFGISFLKCSAHKTLLGISVWLRYRLRSKPKESFEVVFNLRKLFLFPEAILNPLQKCPVKYAKNGNS